MELFTEGDHLAEARYRKLLREQPGFAWRRFSDGEELMAYVFFPPGHEASSSVPSVLFFHGGMWVGKSLGDFVPWALHLAQQGIAGIIVGAVLLPVLSHASAEMGEKIRA